MHEEDIVVPLPKIVVRFGPYGFLKYAGDFLKLAQTLPPEEVFSPVPYYLICRSLELGLKAFVLANGDDEKYLKTKLNHDLIKCLERANHHQLADVFSASSDEHAELVKANKYYAEKGFEYFKVGPAIRGYQNLPSLPKLEAMSERLIAAVNPICLDSTTK